MSKLRWAEYNRIKALPIETRESRKFVFRRRDPISGKAFWFQTVTLVEELGALWSLPMRGGASIPYRGWFLKEVKK